MLKFTLLLFLTSCYTYHEAKCRPAGQIEMTHCHADGSCTKEMVPLFKCR